MESGEESRLGGENRVNKGSTAGANFGVPRTPQR
jgi:hypothetical protein